MGFIAEYHVSYRHLPLTGVATAVPGMTLRLDVGQPNQAGPPPFVVRATGEAFSVHRLTEITLDDDPDPGMIDRQREALLAAHEMGYFEILRAATLTEVATVLGISVSSLSERLRRVQTRLIERSVSDGM